VDENNKLSVFLASLKQNLKLAFFFQIRGVVRRGRWVEEEEKSNNVETSSCGGKGRTIARPKYPSHVSLGPPCHRKLKTSPKPATIIAAANQRHLQNRMLPSLPLTPKMPPPAAFGMRHCRAGALSHPD
jgi:hypothetical protein